MIWGKYHIMTCTLIKADTEQRVAYLAYKDRSRDFTFLCHWHNTEQRVAYLAYEDQIERCYFFMSLTQHRTEGGVPGLERKMPSEGLLSGLLPAACRVGDKGVPSNKLLLPLCVHARGKKAIFAHTHTVDARTHMIDAHTHMVDAHTHMVGAHTHGWSTHTYRHMLDFRRSEQSIEGEIGKEQLALTGSWLSSKKRDTSGLLNPSCMLHQLSCTHTHRIDRFGANPRSAPTHLCVNKSMYLLHRYNSTSTLPPSLRLCSSLVHTQLQGPMLLRVHLKSNRSSETKQFIWNQVDHLKSSRSSGIKQIIWNQADHLESSSSSEIKQIIWNQADHLKLSRSSEFKQIIWIQADHLESSRSSEIKQIIWDQADHLKSSRSSENK